MLKVAELNQVYVFEIVSFKVPWIIIFNDI